MATGVRWAAGAAIAMTVLAGGVDEVAGQQWLNAPPNPKTNMSNFRALEEWAAPNEFRNAAGKPGPKYWQQQVDYAIKASLDTTTHTITGSERVTYHNNSPDQLEYLWFQLDQNIDDPAVSRTIQGAPALPRQISAQARRFLAPRTV